MISLVFYWNSDRLLSFFNDFLLDFRPFLNKFAWFLLVFEPVSAVFSLGFDLFSVAVFA